MTGTASITVSAWGTPQGTQKDPTAQWHDCLWEIAAEQATLEYMEKHKVDWQTAAAKIGAGDIRRNLDKICDENGFRHIDGTGSGNDPNLIADGKTIKVERDPLTLTSTPAGLSVGPGSKALQQYNAVTGGPQHTDWTKKTELDNFLKSIPNLAQLSDATQAALIAAYARGADKPKLAALVGTEAFGKLRPEQQQQLLADYGTPGHEATTKTIDDAVAANKADPKSDLGKVLQGVLEPTVGKTIPAGTTLQSGASVTSADGKTKLIIQEDGNFVVYVDGKAVWSTNTSFWGSRTGPAGDHAVWQQDGNLVLYDSSGKKAWASNTAGHEGARLVLKDDGKLVIYDKDGKQIWSSRK